MTLSERLEFCRVCQNRKFDKSVGILCGITDAKPEFEGTCDLIVVDEAEAKRTLQRQEALRESEVESGFFAQEKRGMKKGVLGGVIMIAIAFAWFFGGLALGRIFYYPPVLAIFGIVAIVKGMAEGNISGEKYKQTR